MRYLCDALQKQNTFNNKPRIKFISIHKLRSLLLLFIFHSLQLLLCGANKNHFQSTVNAITTVRLSTNRIFSSSLSLSFFYPCDGVDFRRYSPIVYDFFFIRNMQRTNIFAKRRHCHIRKKKNKSVKRNQNSIEFQKDVNNQLEMLASIAIHICCFLSFLSKMHTIQNIQTIHLSLLTMMSSLTSISAGFLFAFIYLSENSFVCMISFC